LFIAVVWLIGDAVVNSSKIRVATLLLAAAVIAACAVKTDTQVKVWGNSVTLFSHVLDVDPRGELPNLSLGIAYMNHGRLADAQEYYDRALNYKPSSALRLAPDSPDALTNMALWSNLSGRPKDEETYSRLAIAANPNFIMARLYLSDALQAQGRPDEAAQENRRVLAIDPGNCDALNNLGALLDKQGLTAEALKEFRLSLASKPDQAVAHSKIGRILMQTHQLPEAVEEFTQALRFEPANADAHNDLGVALFQLGDYEKAAEQFSDAVRINPAHANARQNLEVAQARMKSK
jgi:tetratricopeptide (TPR) repeat protein